MDNIIQKFYSNGKDSQNYHHLGAFSSSMIINTNPISSLTHKTIDDFKPTIKTINPSTHNINYKTSTPQRNPKMTREAFLNPKPLVFNSSSDMLYHNPLNYNQRGEFNLFKENVLYENKKNNTKMQMIEEKMKNLELKNQRLEVINDFFFDMFENNLVKDEIKRQRELKAQEEENKNYDDDSEYSTSENNYFRKRKKHKKFHKSKSDINLNRYDNRKNQFDALSFQLKTAQNARTILENIKKNIGNYLIEEELKKNEQYQSINEGINELKSDLNYKLDKIQKNQKQQMQKLAYCLLNSGDSKIEGLAMRLFNYDFSDINNIENILNNEINKNTNNNNEDNDENYNNNDYIQNNEIRSKRNSQRSSIGNNFRSSAASKRNSLQKNNSQISINRKTMVKFKDDN